MYPASLINVIDILAIVTHILQVYELMHSIIIIHIGLIIITMFSKCIGELPDL